MLKMLFLSTSILAYLAIIALLLRVRVPKPLAILVAFGGIVAISVRCYFFTGGGWDYFIFWQAGVDLWDGKDPYAAVEVLNPPPALPLFALMGTLSREVSLMAWTTVNIVFGSVLVWLTSAALRAQDNGAGWSLPVWAALVLTGVVADCPANRTCLYSGALSIFTTFAIVAALLFHGWARFSATPLYRIGAGAFLAVGTIKVATLIPFLSLFHRKRDILAWASMALVCLALSLLFIPPMEMPDRCQKCLNNIGALAQPNRINDYSFSNYFANHILSFEHLFYRLGVRDRQALQLIQFAVLGLLGSWIFWLSAAGKLSPPAACAVVACFAVMFLYHRYYDASILVVPLVYSAGRSLSEHGLSRRLFVASVIPVLVVLNMRWTLMDHLSELAAAATGFTRWLIEAFGLAYGDWCVLIAMFLLIAAERCRMIAAEKPIECAN
jgi:hypothetical protein